MRGAIAADIKVSLRWAIVLLAGGAGQRMGGVPKGLIHAECRTILRRLVDASQVLSPVQTVLVTGQHHDALRTEVDTWPTGLRPEVIRHPSPGADPGRSLHLGLSQLRPGCNAVMVLLTDLALIDAADLHAAAKVFAQRANGKDCVWPFVDGVPAHPVMLTTTMAHGLVTRCETRLREWRTEHPERFQVWATGNSHFIRDIDEPVHLAQLRQDSGLDWQLPTPAPVPHPGQP